MLRGVRPRQDTTPLVEWELREYKAVADHAANCALDMATFWETPVQRSFAKLAAQGVNHRLAVDDAHRGNGQAAGGMAVWAYRRGEEPSCLYRAGATFGWLSSSLAAEVIALEWALETFVPYFVV